MLDYALVWRFLFRRVWQLEPKARNITTQVNMKISESLRSLFSRKAAHNQFLTLMSCHRVMTSFRGVLRVKWHFVEKKAHCEWRRHELPRYPSRSWIVYFISFKNTDNINESTSLILTDEIQSRVLRWYIFVPGFC